MKRMIKIKGEAEMEGIQEEGVQIRRLMLPIELPKIQTMSLRPNLIV